MAPRGFTEITEFTLEEVCKNCDLTTVQVTAYIQEGLIDIQTEEVSLWRFSETHIVRLQKASRLEKDLRLNPAGVVLALELMAEIENLKKRVQSIAPD